MVKYLASRFGLSHWDISEIMGAVSHFMPGQFEEILTEQTPHFGEGIVLRKPIAAIWTTNGPI
jgi:hypothetical protein